MNDSRRIAFYERDYDLWKILLEPSQQRWENIAGRNRAATNRQMALDSTLKLRKGVLCFFLERNDFPYIIVQDSPGLRRYDFPAESINQLTLKMVFKILDVAAYGWLRKVDFTGRL